MSTRATYLFKSTRPYHNNAWCIYIHHDGYEQGAANYLYNAFLQAGHIDAVSMIRGNDQAELTFSHESHGDTEYRYTITGDNLKAKHGYGDKWHTVFDGDWLDFINQHVPASGWVDDFQAIKRCAIDEYSKAKPVTKSMLEKALDADLKLCGIWASNDRLAGCNGDHLKGRIATMTQTLKDWQP